MAALLHAYLDDPDDENPRRRVDALKHDEDGPVFTTFQQDIAPYISELLGTFLLTFTILLNYSEQSNRVWAGLSNAFMNMVLKYSLDHISGGLVNPSLSVSLFLAGRLPFRKASRLVVVQIIGACLAGWLRFSVGTINVSVGPKQGHSYNQVALVEILYTSLLCFVFLNTAASPKNQPRDDRNGIFGMSVGFVFIAASYAGSAVSFVVLNSAVSIGIAVVEFRETGSFSGRPLGYFFYDFAGAFIGTWLYRLVRPEDFQPALHYDSDNVDDRAQKAGIKVTSEFIGTFFVVLTKCLSRASLQSSECWSMMAVVAALVYSLRDVSGAHFNPAVTLAVKLSGQGALDVSTTFLYVFCQLIAGHLAAALCPTFGANHLAVRLEQASDRAAAVTEALFTGLVCYVVLATGTSNPVKSRTQRNNVAGLAYGASHLIGSVSARHISGCILNPVVAIAFSSLNAIRHRETCMGYVPWELVGSIGAVVLFTLSHPHYVFVGREEPGGGTTPPEPLETTQQA